MVAENGWLHSKARPWRSETQQIVQIADRILPAYLGNMRSSTQQRERDDRLLGVSGFGDKSRF
jgi:hypothetical protein